MNSPLFCTNVLGLSWGCSKSFGVWGGIITIKTIKFLGNDTSCPSWSPHFKVEVWILSYQYNTCSSNLTHNWCAPFETEDSTIWKFSFPCHYPQTQIHQTLAPIYFYKSCPHGHSQHTQIKPWDCSSWIYVQNPILMRCAPKNFLCRRLVSQKVWYVDRFCP